MRLWIFLALISLAKSEITTTTTEATVEEGTGKSSEIKEKRTADESSLQNPEYEGYSIEGYQSQQRTQIQNLHPQSTTSGPIKNQISYVVQDQPQLSYGTARPQAPSGAQVSYIQLRPLLGPQGQFPRYNLPYPPGEQYHSGGTTFTIQYVPASSIYRSAGNSQKYVQVSKTNQVPVKTPNSLVYLAPGQGQPYLYSNPQYSAAQTQTTYFQPQYTHPTAFAAPPVATSPQASAQSSGGIVYTLQPVVMTFALPGTHYVTPHTGHSPLFGGGVRPVLYYPYQSAPVSYAPQRQQVSYVLPSQLHNQQQAVTPRTATGGSSSGYESSAAHNISTAYRIRSQSAPQFQQIKG